MNSMQLNEKLPFDVLGLIFGHYAEEETINYSLETLLLVCRSWNEAAVGHRSLWGSFKIHLSHEPSSEIWTKRVPLRLARCGPRTLLHIELRNLLDSTPSFFDGELDPPHAYESLPCPFSYDGEPSHWGDPRMECHCHAIARACAGLSLQSLAGDNGEYSSRWKVLALDLGQDQAAHQLTMASAIALSHPTPNLTNLKLKGMRFRPRGDAPRCFPNIPNLESVSVVDCSFPTLPDFTNIVQAEVGWSSLSRNTEDIYSFRDAAHLQSLSLRPLLNVNVFFPTQLPELTFLQIIGEDPPNDLIHCQMPQLSHLSVRFQGGFDEVILWPILRCQGIPVETLKRITLEWRMHSCGRSFLIEAGDSVLQLLARAKKLEIISAEKDILNIIIKTLWDLKNSDSPPAFFSSETVLEASITNQSSKSIVSIPRDSDTLFFEALARKWHLVPPNLPHEEFYAQVSGHTF